MEQKNLFERYQIFFAFIILGLLIGGGIIISKVIPAQTAGNEQQGETKESVRKDLIKTAKQLGIDQKDFSLCLDNEDKKEVVDTAIQLANKSGVEGTPTFFILKRTLNTDEVVTSEKQFIVLGARDKTTFETAIAEGRSPVDQPPQKPGEKIVLTDNDHWFGPKDAKIVIVEYSDIDCPFCKRAKPVIDELLKENPEYAFVYRHAPIVSLHPLAAYKAEATECAKEAGGSDAFWSLLDVIAA